MKRFVSLAFVLAAVAACDVQNSSILEPVPSAVVLPVGDPADGWEVVAGPELFTRGRGKPQEDSRAYLITDFARYEQPMTVFVQNGAEDGSLRVSSAIVEVNGEVVFGPSDFGQGVSLLTAEIAIPESGTITVELRSKPGSQVSIWIEARRKAPGGQIAFHSARDGNHDVYVVNADGSGIENITQHPAWDSNPEWSPDGSRIAFQSNRDGDFDVWVMNADGTGLCQVTNHPSRDWKPAWSTDGESIAFGSDRDGLDFEVYVVSPLACDGSGSVTRLTNAARLSDRPDWAPIDRIVFETTRSPVSVWTMDSDGSNQQPLVPGVRPSWSPGGAAVVFATQAGSAIQTIGSDGTGIRTLYQGICDGPDWSPDGEWIVFGRLTADGGAGVAIIPADPAGVLDINSPEVLQLTDRVTDGRPSWRPM